MKSPAVPQAKPCLVETDKGKKYFWCACGLSKQQPFCDGSHKDTGFLPLVWTAGESGEMLFCSCKQTQSAPFCDGSHNKLSDTYANADAGHGAGVKCVGYKPDERGAFKATLDNHCYVIRVPEEAMTRNGVLQIFQVIGAADSAQHLSQYLGVVATGESPILGFPDSDVVLFISAGKGVVRIGTKSFPVTPECGVCIRPGEAFQVVNEQTDAISLSISVCPPCDKTVVHQQMPDCFDSSVPVRVQGVDEKNRESMADRFFQVLIDAGSHSTPVTQFIGEIPESRAAHHRHLYEETITVLSGEGFMWTDQTKTAVMPGDTIFLPMKQAHSLECTSKGGMRLMGLFYPSMSPAINY